MKKLLSYKALIIALFAIIGVCLILFSGGFSSKNKSADTSPEYYTELLESKIEDLLLEMKEIDSVSVLITLENSGETLYAQNQGANFSEYVLYNNENSQEGLKIAEITPKVRGVAVICNNGDNIKIQSKIISILSSALGVPTNKITVSN